MSKFEPLWHNISMRDSSDFTMTFEEIQEVLGFPIDHSFLNAKKELIAYGYQVGHISLKGKTVSFERVK